MTKQWTILDALKWTEQRLSRQGETHPRLAAQLLASQATGLSRIDLYAYFDKPLSEQERTLLRESIQRRLNGEPLQYIVGSVGFRHLELKVREPVLIPRPETELLVELVLGYVKECRSSKPQILDLCTGSGAIALSLVHELPQVQVIATDIDEAAVALAQENAHTLKFDDAERLSIFRDDVASSLIADETKASSFDVIASNPPYIPTAEYEQLPAEIMLFESRRALDGGVDGLDVFRRIAAQALRLLKPEGLLVMELHEQCLDEAAEYLANLSYEGIEIHTDLTGRQRFVTASRT